MTEHEAELPAGWDTWDRRHPPFAEGNTMATVVHGAYSPRRVDPLAADIREQTLAAPELAYLRSPRWSAAVWAWVRTEARIQLVTEFLTELAGEGQLGDLEDPRVAAAYRLLDRLEASGVQQRGRLGLDPLSASKIGRDQAAASVDIAQLMAELHRRDQDQEQERGAEQ